MSWRDFTAAPHRVMFLVGGLQGILAVAWWLADLHGRYGGGTPLPASVPSLWLHAFLMMYAFFPFYIFGFLMTAAPNWVNGEKVPRSAYLATFLPMAAGVAFIYGGGFQGKGWLGLGVGALLTGWFIGAASLLHIVARSGHPDRRHAYTVIGVLFTGWLGGLAYLLWLWTGGFLPLRLALVGGLWLFLLPTFVSVSHRMIPYFSSTVLPDYVLRRPYPALFALLGGMALHAVLELADAHRWLWLADLPMAATAFWLTTVWGFRRSFAERLLAVLHIGFLWLGVALALYGIQSLVLFLTGRHILGLAPLHALTIGYFASMVLAMASRVTLGHSGRPLVADGVTWALFLGFQSTALLRVAGDTPLADALPPGALYLAAAAVWLTCFILWGAKYLPIYWRPRADGKPG